MFFANLFHARLRHPSGTALYVEVRTDSDSAAKYAFEPLGLGALDPPIRGYQLGQGPGIMGASSTPFIQLANVPIGAGYMVGEVYQERLYQTKDSLSAQELI